MIQNAMQGTEEWKQARCGFVTASRFADVMTEPRSKSDGGMSKTAESYLYELIGEHLTGKPADDYQTYAMKWGNDHEPAAREAYVWSSGLMVKDAGFELHDEEDLIGCSPDGFVDSDGLIECKCPLTYANHVRVLVTGKMPDEHMAQVQGGLWITGRKWSDFVSYHPSCKTDATKLAVVRVLRDEKYIADMAQKVIRFRNRLIETLELIKSRSLCKS